MWEGVVYVFDLEDHPKATRAYAWSSPVEGSDRRRFYAVLHLVPRHRGYDGLIWSHSRIGISCGEMRITMLLATPGCRWMRPAHSSPSTI